MSCGVFPSVKAARMGESSDGTNGIREIDMATSTERQRKFKSERKADGFVRVSTWVHETQKSEFKKRVKKLLSRLHGDIKE